MDLRPDRWAHRVSPLSLCVPRPLLNGCGGSFRRDPYPEKRWAGSIDTAHQVRKGQGWRRLTTYFIPSIGQFLFIVIFLVLSVMPTGKQMLADADTGYHIRAGEYILDNLTVPRQDIFSFRSPPLPWTAHEWLSEVIMASLHRVSGITGVVLFFIFLIALTDFLLYRYLRTRQRNVIFDVLIVCPAVISSQIHWLARPQISSLLLMVLWYAILEGFQDERRHRPLLL